MYQLILLLLIQYLGQLWLQRLPMRVGLVATTINSELKNSRKDLPKALIVGVFS